MLSSSLRPLLSGLLLALLLATGCGEGVPRNPGGQGSCSVDGCDAATAPDGAPDTGAAVQVDGGTLDGGPGPADAGAADQGVASADLGGAPDTGVADLGCTDGGGPVDAADAGTGADEGCSFGDPGDPDRERVVLIGNPFGAAAGTEGTSITSLTLPAAGGVPVADGIRFDVGTKPARIAFVPSGELALVLGEDGTLVSLRVRGAGDLELAGVLSLPGTGYVDLTIAADGRTAWATSEDVGLTSGVSTVHLGCDGSLSDNAAEFLNIRLSSSLAVFAGEQRAVLLGGQTVFEPVDDDDLRLLGRAGDGWTELAAFDVYHDFIDCGRIALSPDGATVLVPNGSPFSADGNEVAVVAVQGDVLAETVRLTELASASEAAFAPDGRTALVTQPEVNRVTVLADRGAGFEVVDQLGGLGLADQLAVVARGALAGLVLVPIVDPSGGSFLALLRVTGPGQVESVGRVALGEGMEQIPGAVGVTP